MTKTALTMARFSGFEAILWLLAMQGRVQSSPHEQRLIQDLMMYYNTLERPVANESEALLLKVARWR